MEGAPIMPQADSTPSTSTALVKSLPSYTASSSSKISSGLFPPPIPIILVVDDREENLESMRVILGDNDNWQLRCVNNGEAALRCLLREDVSLVLLDVQMPGMDGYEVAELMRANPNTRHTPIIFISAIARTKALILRGYDRGAVDFILKPFDPTILQQKIHNLLGYERNRRALLRLNQQLESERSFNESLLSNAAEGILVVGEDGMIQYANPAMAQMSKRDMDALIGCQFLELFSFFDDPNLSYKSNREPIDMADHPKNWQASPFYQHWQANQIYRLHEINLKQKDGSDLPISISCAPLPRPQRAMVALVRDMAVEHELRSRMESLIITDPLTGLLNRRGFTQATTSALARTKRSGNQIAVIFIDLDGFKHINDSLGHDVGDKILQYVAKQLKSGIRPYDSLARMGGDEFTILLDGLKQCSDAAGIVDKLMKLISERYKICDEEFTLSASAGIACYPEGGDDSDTLLRAADMAMYEAKRNGRQHYRFHSPQMTERAVARLELEQRMRQAVDDKQFILAYQPQYYLDSGQLRGFEALLRWPHGNRDSLTPDQFIAFLEETRLINQLGNWIFNEGIARLVDLKATFGEQTTLALNVSPVQFIQPQMVNNLQAILEEHHLAPNQLELEVTESVLMQNIDITHTHLHHLRQLGISVAVDDFGTGYSSLAYLRQFELDILKIDKLFITNMLENQRDAALVSTIIDLSHNLNLQVVAEGVETQEQREWLHQHGCTIMQGYLVSPALPFEAALRVPAKIDWENPQISPPRARTITGLPQPPKSLKLF